VVAPYSKWLRARTRACIEVIHEKLTGPTQFGEIHEASVRVVRRALGENPRETALTFHLSPGTPAMAAVWILLGKTRFPAELIESSKEHGVRTASVPFEISADFIPTCSESRTSDFALVVPPSLPKRQSSPTSSIAAV